MDNRLIALTDWARQVLGTPGATLAPASGDASFRRYFRVHAADATYIAMDAPPAKEDVRPYIAIAERFAALGLNVPQILARDVAAGFLLITDLGSTLYLSALNEATVERLYGDALGALVVLQAGIYTEQPGVDSTFPDYDAALLRREMELFREWYLGVHLRRALDARQHALLDQAFDRLTAAALEQPRVWVHRDYHSRNLMRTPTNNPGILDFQDAVRGPATYDLVSLLKDCYIAWPRARVEAWVRGYHTLARQSGLPVDGDEARFLRSFDLMGIQRHLKATGIFARLNHRDGKPGYLADIPRTLGYVLEAVARYPELAAFAALLHELGLPEAR